MEPTRQVVAINTRETVGLDWDDHVSLVTSGGSSLFAATDLAVPPQTWVGDDPAITGAFQQLQAFLDSDWQAAMQQNPSDPQWPLEWQFESGNGQDEMRVVGWDAMGHALVEGRALLHQRCPNYRDAETTTFDPWQGRLAPVGPGRWDWAMRDYGAPPAPVAHRRLGDTRIELSIETLTVDGVVHTNPELAAGVLAFDGPFS